MPGIAGCGRRRGLVSQVSKIADKAFFGKNIIHVALFKKNDEKTIYNMIYQDGLVALFAFGGIYGAGVFGWPW